MKKFWNWARDEESGARTLYLDGTIAEESWFDDDVTPKAFKADLTAGEGDIVIWINSPGGDCIAASQIYAMLMDYKGSVTVKIDGIAASAASVIAMAGTKVRKNNKTATMRRSTITPSSYRIILSGSSSGSTPMRASPEPAQRNATGLRA